MIARHSIRNTWAQTSDTLRSRSSVPGIEGTSHAESSEFDIQFHPGSARRAGSEERDALQREIPGLISCCVCGEGPVEKRTLGGKSRISALGRRVVMAVEQIIDLNRELEPFGQIVVSPE